MSLKAFSYSCFAARGGSAKCFKSMLKQALFFMFSSVVLPLRFAHVLHLCFATVFCIAIVFCHRVLQSCFCNLFCNCALQVCFCNRVRSCVLQLCAAIVFLQRCFAIACCDCVLQYCAAITHPNRWKAQEVLADKKMYIS